MELEVGPTFPYRTIAEDVHYWQQSGKMNWLNSFWRNFDMARKDWPTDPAEIQRSIEEAIQHFVKKGWLVDSGQRRWSQRTGRYEIVWESTVFGKTLQ